MFKTKLRYTWHVCIYMWEPHADTDVSYWDVSKVMYMLTLVYVFSTQDMSYNPAIDTVNST